MPLRSYVIQTLTYIQGSPENPPDPSYESSQSVPGVAGVVGPSEKTRRPVLEVLVLPHV